MIALHKGAPAIGPGLVMDAATTESEVAPR
jgi:hypothetical protein